MMDVKTISVARETTIREALARLDRTGFGLLVLLTAEGRFVRTVSDGDLRRLMLDGASLDDRLDNLPQTSSITVAPTYTRREALNLMQTKVINHLPVVDEQGTVIDIVERAKIDQHVLLSTPHMGATEIDFVNQAFSTNWIAPLGPNVDAFERELASLVGAGHAVALSSGTAAIHLALVMLGVGPGDKVFCSSLTFAASVNPIIYQGAEPVLVDSEPDSWNMSPQALERALSRSKGAGKLPKAVIVVSLYGQSADMYPLIEICDAYGVPIVEDAAESLGASYKGKASGTFGKMGIYSFNGNKIITTSGGGMLVTEDKALADRARFLATQARDPAPHYQHSTVGYNYRMSNILAGVGRGQLKVLADRVASRRGVFEMYRHGLADVSWIDWMPEPDWSHSTRWLTAFVIKEDADLTAAAIIDRLSAELIEARPVWKPMHLQPVFEKCDYYTHDNRSVSTLLFESGVCLPSGSNLTEEQVDRVISIIRSIH